MNNMGSDTGQRQGAAYAALRLSCNVLITKCPGVSRLCPGENMQIANAKRPIGKGFRCLSRLSRLSRHKTVGVGRNHHATGARVWGGGGESCCVKIAIANTYRVQRLNTAGKGAGIRVAAGPPRLIPSRVIRTALFLAWIVWQHSEQPRGRRVLLSHSHCG